MPADVVRGIPAIAVVLACSRATVRRIARKAPRADIGPLRLWSAAHDPMPWSLHERLTMYRRRWRTPDDPSLARVQNWPAIAACLGVNAETAERLARREHDPLPVGFTATGKREAYLHALLDWLDAQSRPHVVRVEERRERAERRAA